MRAARSTPGHDGRKTSIEKIRVLDTPRAAGAFLLHGDWMMGVIRGYCRWLHGSGALRQQWV